MPAGVGHNSKHKAHVTFYPAYHFRAKEQDPIIDRMQTIAEEAGTIDQPGKMHEMTGLSTSTFASWFTNRSVLRPRYCSIAAFARAHGYDIALVRTANKANGKPWAASQPPILSRRG